MHKIILKLLSNYPLLIKVSVFTFSFFLILFESNSQAGEVRLTTDFVSWGLSAMAHPFDIGLPYVNYWGINPPGVLAFTALWGILVGHTLISFHLLYILSLSLIIFLVWQILNRFFSIFESWIIFFVFSILFFSSTVQSQFFPSEINGLLFSLLGLLFILKKNTSKNDIFWASFCFILAGQMKEVFALTGLALTPFLLLSIHNGKKETVNFLLYVFGGIGSGVILILSYLLITGSYQEYNKVLQYKSTQFSLDDLTITARNFYHSISYPKERFIYNTIKLPLLLFVSFYALLAYLSLSVKSKNGFIKFKLPEKFLEYGILVFFWFGSTLGYMLQGRYGNKYEIQSILPMILISTLAIKVILRTTFLFFNIKISKNLYSIIIILLVIFMMVPKKFFFVEQFYDFKNYKLDSHINKLLNFENDESIKLELYLKKNTSKQDCITAIYGWGIGSHYYYSQRPSCSKYFLINILPIQAYEYYQNELLDNPPKAIIYNTDGADMNIEKFEQIGFNFTKVLENCYIQDSNHSKLYWSSVKNSEELSECISIGVPKPIDIESM